LTGILHKNNLGFIFLSLLKACRPIQWTKNLLVFAVILFSFKLNKLILINSFYAFISFCFISSAIYLINDIRDIRKDKLHPKKRYRPIPKGDISLNLVKFSSIFLATLGLFIGYLISIKFLLIIIIYGVIQILYCIRLKKEPLLDIICIASGFLLRAISGVIASGLNFSPWFILTIGLLALFLAVEKRKAELIFYKETSILTRETLEKYSLPLLQRYESLLSSSTFISYSLWAAGPSLNGASSPWMLLSIPFVLLGIFRYLFISDPEVSKNLSSKGISLSTENPELILIYDSGIRNLIIFWIITIVLIGIFFH
tara:strand:+ start:185 stop:1123 length:939 start_codon:yes stop_codon:yes gene_type:complete